MSPSVKMDNEIKLQFNSNIADFLGILKKMLLGQILSEKSMEEKIKDFTVDLEEIFLFLWSKLLNIKGSILEYLKNC